MIGSHITNLEGQVARGIHDVNLNPIIHERSSTVMTSAAPTVFGINIYLVILWLVLLYLMFRTGSMSSPSDGVNYAEEIRGDNKR